MCEGQDFSRVAWCLMCGLKHADLFYSLYLLQSYFMMSCECCSIEILKASSILNIAFIDKCVFITFAFTIKAKLQPDLEYF